jgi:ribose/xylose/arabinose/galactoside ABC-type transport system permease subunit
VPGVILAAVLLALLQSALGLHGFSGEGQTMAIGFLLIIAIGIPPMVRTYQNWNRRRRSPVLEFAVASSGSGEEGK